MSTVKTNTIQPVTTGDNLIIRTGAGDPERIRITTNGDVGIGGNPSAYGQLYMTSSALAPLADLYVENTNSALSGGITLATFVTNNAPGDPSDTGAGTRRPRLNIIGTSAGIILNETYNAAANNLMFTIGSNAERMRLNGNGVYIGTHATVDVVTELASNGNTRLRVTSDGVHTKDVVTSDMKTLRWTGNSATSTRTPVLYEPWETVTPKVYRDLFRFHDVSSATNSRGPFAIVLPVGVGGTDENDGAPNYNMFVDVRISGFNTSPKGSWSCRVYGHLNTISAGYNQPKWADCAVDIEGSPPFRSVFTAYAGGTFGGASAGSTVTNNVNRRNAVIVLGENDQNISYPDWTIEKVSASYGSFKDTNSFYAQFLPSLYGTSNGLTAAVISRSEVGAGTNLAILSNSITELPVPAGKVASLSNIIAGGGPVAGCVVPLQCSPTYAVVLPEGKWFVYMTWNENGGNTDEDVVAVMAKVWDVSAGNYLKIYNGSANPTYASSKIYYKVSATSSNATNDGGYTEFVASGAGKNAYDTTLTIGELTTNGTHYGMMITEEGGLGNGGIYQGVGFAIRVG